MNAQVFIFLAPLAMIDWLTGVLPDILIVAFVGQMWSQGGRSWEMALVVVLVLMALKGSMESAKKQPALGWGDIKLMGACALGLSWDQVAPFFLLTGLFGCLMAQMARRSLIPLGPCIVLAFACLTASRGKLL